MQGQSNLDEDSSPLSPGSEGTILALKKARKQIEADAQLLANRIALLKQEELKSWKKIEETKKKAKEVYLLKKKNEEKLREKEEVALRQSSVIKDVQKSSSHLRKEKEKEKQDILTSIYTKKHEGVITQKKSSLKNDLKKKEFQEKIVLVNQEKSQKIKEQEALVLLKKQEALANQLAHNKIEYERRYAEEELLKKKKEAEVLKMEQLEMELIKRLQHTQSLQKAAYEELEAALAQNPGEYAEKYFQNGSEGSSPLKSATSPNINDEQGEQGQQGEAEAEAEVNAESRDSPGVNETKE